MARIISRSALLCALIFGLCEAHWRIEDDWPKNTLPVAKGGIEAEATQTSSFPADTPFELIRNAMGRVRAFIHYLKHPGLPIMDRGFNRRNRIEINMPDTSIYFNLPNRKSLLSLINSGLEQPAFDDMQVRVQTDTESSFLFQTSVTGNMTGYSWNGTHLEVKLSPEAAIRMCDYDDEWTRSPYQVYVRNNSTVKTAVYRSADGIIRKLYQTTDKLENNVFTQYSEEWEHYSKWVMKRSHTQSVDLNDPQREVLLNGLCLSSLNIQKYNGNKIISEKRLICKED